MYFYDAIEYTGLTLIGNFTVLEKDDSLIPDGSYPEGLRGDDYIILKFQTKKAKLYYGMEKYYVDNLEQ